VQLLRRGKHRFPPVAEVQTALVGLDLLTGAHEESVYDDATEHAVRLFQQRRGLSVDGIVGPETYRAINAAKFRLGDRLLSLSSGHPFVGDDVAALQDRLLELGFDAGRPDGVFGARTESALRSFQREYGLLPDGSCGPGDPAGAAPARPARRRRPAPAAARERGPPPVPGRLSPARSSSSTRATAATTGARSATTSRRRPSSRTSRHASTGDCRPRGCGPS